MLLVLLQQIDFDTSVLLYVSATEGSAWRTPTIQPDSQNPGKYTFLVSAPKTSAQSGTKVHIIDIKLQVKSSASSGSKSNVFKFDIISLTNQNAIDFVKNVRGHVVDNRGKQTGSSAAANLEVS